MGIAQAFMNATQTGRKAVPTAYLQRQQQQAMQNAMNTVAKGMLAPTYTPANAPNPNNVMMGGTQYTIPNYNGMNPNMFMPQAPQQTMNMDAWATQYGLDISKDYANRQAEAIKNAKMNGYNNALRSVDADVMNSVNALDRNVFQKQLDLDQNNVNSGINAGIQADRDLRLAMNRQAEMGQIYSDANLKHQNINDEIGSLDAETLAYADSLYNDRRMNAMNNYQNYQQFSNTQNDNYWKMLEGIRQFDSTLALDEGKLTGNYISATARPLIETILKGKQFLASGSTNSIQQAQALKDINEARNKLASMGLDPNKFGDTMTYDNMLGGMGSFNQTIDKVDQIDKEAMTQANMTGKWTDPRTMPLIQQIIDIKKHAYEQKNRKLSPNEQSIIDKNIASLQGMGVDTTKLITGAGGYATILANLKKGVVPIKTQDAIKQEHEIAFDNTQLKQSQQKINNDFILGKEQNALDKTKIGNDYELGKEQNANDRMATQLDAELKREGLTLDYAQLNFDKLVQKQNNALENKKFNSEQDKKNWDATSKANTNAIIQDEMGNKPKDIIKHIQQYGADWVAEGVDIKKVAEALGVLEYLKKGSGGSKSGGGSIDSLFGGK